VWVCGGYSTTTSGLWGVCGWVGVGVCGGVTTSGLLQSEFWICTRTLSQQLHQHHHCWLIQSNSRFAHKRNFNSYTNTITFGLLQSEFWICTRTLSQQLHQHHLCWLIQSNSGFAHKRNCKSYTNTITFGLLQSVFWSCTQTLSQQLHQHHHCWPAAKQFWIRTQTQF